MKPEELSQSIEKGAFAPLYYLYGEEPYLVERAVARIVEKTVSPDFRDFNYNLFYGNECKGNEILESAQTLPMFADRRVVLVRKGGELPAVALELLIPYVQDPAPETILIIQGDKVDQRKKFYQELKKRGALVEFRRLYENQLIPFIRETARSHGKRIEPAAAEMLVYLVGNNLREISAQVDKVATFAGERDVIGLQDVKTIVSDTRVESVFDLANALGAKELPRALRSLDTMLRDGEAPLMILTMITRHFRQLWRVSELISQRQSQQEIARVAGVNPYFLKGVMEQARKYGVAELKSIFDELFRTDLALKSGVKQPDVILERLVMGICTADSKSW